MEGQLGKCGSLHLFAELSSLSSLFSQAQLVEVLSAVNLETLEIDHPLGATGSTVTSCATESVQVERRKSFKSVVPPLAHAFHPGDDVLSLMSRYSCFFIFSEADSPTPTDAEIASCKPGYARRITELAIACPDLRLVVLRATFNALWTWNITRMSDGEVELDEPVVTMEDSAMRSETRRSAEMG